MFSSLSDGPDPSLAHAAARLAHLLTAGGNALTAPNGDLVFESAIELRPLRPLDPPVEVWAVDGGQSMVIDARCLQLVAVRAAAVRWRNGICDLEHQGSPRAHVVGTGEDRATLASLGAPVRPDASLDINLLREWEEWSLVERCVADAARGAVVLVDGDLQPDWRISSSFLDGLLDRAQSREVTLAGVTKHSSLSRGGAPLLAQLEAEGDEIYGPRGMWWAPLARTRSDVGDGIAVLAARLDPDARFAFRIDLPAGADAEAVLARLAGASNDAAFPGYPYPLSVVDGLAACGRWIREDLSSQLETYLDLLGVPTQVRERAFGDRHRMMERA